MNERDQLELVEDLVDTRGAELARAYPNVVEVSVGFKRVAAGAGGEQVIRRPAVVFLVRAKWEAGDTRQARDGVPPFLLATWWTHAGRELCAVPTDVQGIDDRTAFTARAGITVTQGQHRSTGTVTCALVRSLGGVPVGGGTQLMSCRHVFSLSKALPEDLVGTDVRLRGQGASRLAVGLDVRGELRDGAQGNLDAQLAVVEDADRQGAEFVTHFEDIALFPEHITSAESLFVLTHDGPVRCEFSRFPPRVTVNYLQPGRTRVAFDKPIELKSVDGPRLDDGTSGAAIASRPDGGRLLGMLIASDDSHRIGIGLPAWRFMFPDAYDIDFTERWTVL